MTPSIVWDYRILGPLGRPDAASRPGNASALYRAPGKLRVPGSIFLSYQHPHFTDKETEVQRGCTAGKQWSHDLDARSLDSQLGSIPNKV